MSKIVGITINDSKVYFSVIEGSYPTCERIRPVDLAISFHDGKLNFFSDALNAKSCISSLIDIRSLKNKIEQDNNCRKIVSDEYEIWVLLMKQMNEHIKDQLNCSEELQYIIAIPENSLESFRDVISIACKVNQMKLLRIITVDCCSILGYTTTVTEFYPKADECNNKLILGVNLDDFHTSITTYFVSRTVAIKINEVSCSIGQRDFLSLVANILNINNDEVTLNSDIDSWNYKYRKVAEPIYDVINRFSDSNITQTYYSNDDGESIEVTKEQLKESFKNFIKVLGDLVKDSITKTKQIIKDIKFINVIDASKNCVVQSQLEDMKQLEITGLYLCGEHKNSFINREIEQIVGVSGEPSVNQKKINAQGCGWYVRKTEWKGMTGKELLSFEDFNKCVSIDTVIQPNQLYIQSVQNNQKIEVINTPQLASDLIKLPPLDQGVYKILFKKVEYDYESTRSEIDICIGEFTVQDKSDVLKLGIQKFINNFQGVVGCFCADESSDFLLEKGCECCERDPKTYGPTGKEFGVSLFSSCSVGDEDVDLVWKEIEECNGIEEIEKYSEITSTSKSIDTQKYLGVFEKQKAQLERVEKASEIASKIRNTEMKDLIQVVGEKYKREIIREVNRLIQANRDNPDDLQNKWADIVSRYQSK
ncbi:hypothetical protein EDI_316950 [Entamoeba dispar SAW760]|uniref:Uncharacterized protein n=1 Tax=Entamoeba dispar (strain ATCC PRA-260 / SAW760) TaxID=370354 RepID=B0EKH4_ENTDS|nr:uncharacterized protein EDI_316950 [Entamoeba dispar SAW760]EDR24978.1 hypothetical protein EDI_316950 [Entamoeba dispar SAW760]|eukprot:EDR24978.1 hypothetical protein EDI_316950 [Entamoeba dispar SAW760]